MAGNVHELNEENFESEVLSASQPVLVDFWAPWCGPCRRIAPMIDELAQENLGSIKVGKVNTDDNRDLAVQYGVSALPTLMLFKNGDVSERFVGGAAKERLQESLDAAKA